VLIPGSVLGALGIDTLVAQRRRAVSWGGVRRAAVRPALEILVLVTLIGQLAVGWPAAFERLPVAYGPGIWDQSVDGREVALAEWSKVWLGTGNRFAGTGAADSVVSGIGGQDGVLGVSAFFLWDKLTPSEDVHLQKMRIRYIIADQRMTTMLPLGGAYFTSDPFSDKYAAPLPAEDLAKFGHLAGVSRVYTDGVIDLYDIGETKIG
jgi:hypothetical protein